MVATTQSPPPPLAMARRSFTAAIEPPADRRQSTASRRHSFALCTTANTGLVELRSPRSLEEYEAELQAAWTRQDERSPRDFGSSLPRKLTLSRRQPTSLRRRSTKGDDEPAVRLTIVGPRLPQMETVVADVLHGFQAHVGPVAVDDGTGGVYYLRTKAQRIVAVFKPSDEEPFAVNNPKIHRPEHAPLDDTMASKGLLVSGIRGGISPGHAAIREVAAYLVDHGRRAGVPPTVFVAAKHPAFFRRALQSSPLKLGSLQLYVPHDCTADDISESLLPVDQVQAMAILDIRLANQDRHGGNVLVVSASSVSSLRKGYNLIPIDHGACLPRVSCLDETSFLWQHWPQAKQPFSLETTAFIASLDAVSDAQQLAQQLPTAYQLEDEALLTLVVGTVLLQVCAVDFGMTAHAIATLMCRQEPTEASVLEQLIKATMDGEVGNREHATPLPWTQRAMRTAARFQFYLRQYLTERTTAR